MAARLVKVFHVRLELPQGTINTPHPLGALNGSPGPPRVVSAPKAEAKVQPPSASSAAAGTCSPAEGEHATTAPSRCSATIRARSRRLRANPGRNTVPDRRRHGVGETAQTPKQARTSRLSVRDIAVTMAAVIVVAFGFTALLPSILTRDAVECATVVAAAACADRSRRRRAGRRRAVRPWPPCAPAAAAPPRSGFKSAPPPSPKPRRR